MSMRTWYSSTSWIMTRGDTEPTSKGRGACGGLINGDPTAHNGPVCFHFSKFCFSENQDYEISGLLGESVV